MSKDGGPAFPVSVRKTEKYMDEAGYGRTREVVVIDGGMTLRDYFAAQVLPAVWTAAASSGQATPDVIASESYKVADAMLKVRSE